MGAARCVSRSDERKRVRRRAARPLPRDRSWGSSTTHLGNPDNALYAFSRGCKPAVQRSVRVAVLFLGASGLRIGSASSPNTARPRVQNALLGAAIVASVAFLASVAFAYASEDGGHLGHAFVPVALCLNALVGGPVLALAGLRFSRWSPLAGRAGGRCSRSR